MRKTRSRTVLAEGAHLIGYTSHHSAAMDRKSLPERGRDRKGSDAKTGNELFTFRGHTGVRFRPGTAPTDREFLHTATIRRKCGIPRREQNFSSSTDTQIEWLSRCSAPMGRESLLGAPTRPQKVWNAKTGAAELSTLNGHTDTVLCASFSPDGSRIVTGAPTLQQRFGMRNSARSFLPSKGHPVAVRYVTFSPDGLAIGTSCVRMAKIWDSRPFVATLPVAGATSSRDSHLKQPTKP